MFLGFFLLYLPSTLTIIRKLSLFLAHSYHIMIMIAKVGRLNWIMVEKRDGTVVFITLYIKELPFCNKCQLHTA